MNNILNELQAQVGPLPGRYKPRPWTSIFDHLSPALIHVLAKTNLTTSLKGNPQVWLKDCELCQKYLMKAVIYQQKMNFLYPKPDTMLDFLAERPGKMTN